MVLRLPMTFCESILSWSLGILSSLFVASPGKTTPLVSRVHRLSSPLPLDVDPRRYRTTGGAERPGADGTDILRLDWQPEVRVHGDGQALIDRIQGTVLRRAAR